MDTVGSTFSWLKKIHRESKKLFQSPPKKKVCKEHIGMNSSLNEEDKFFSGSYFCISNQLIKQHRDLRNIIEKLGGSITSFLSSQVCILYSLY